MADGYCELVDVRRALQESSFDGAIGQENDIGNDAITGLTQWLRRRTRHHWYDTGGGTTLVPTSARTASNVVLDVPSGPHRQDRQIPHAQHSVEYPTTKAGPYAKIRLPHYDVQTINKLEVRDRGGGVTDWVADSDFVSGRGEDYYLLVEGEEFQRSYLYIHGGEIGSRVNFDHLLTLDYDYGTDEQTRSWESVRRSVAMLAAADLVLDEDVMSMVPDNGQLINVQTKAERYVKRALDRGLKAYFTRPVA